MRERTKAITNAFVGSASKGPHVLKKLWYQLKLGHSRVTYAALVGMSRTNVSKMTGNPEFASPIPSLAKITAAADRLSAALDAYDFSRSRQDKEERDTAFLELKALRADLGGYVQSVSQGDQAIITSAGFETEKPRHPVGQLPAPGNVRAVVMPYPGSIELLFNGVKGRLSYQVSICGGDPTLEENWKLAVSTGKTRVSIDGLESDRTYYFRVTALGAAGFSPVSDVAKAKAA